MVFSWEGIIGVMVAMEGRGVGGMQEVKERNNKVISCGVGV
jgi:hypothetical protein